ncbi:dihydrofolate reductase family protein [uncultured Winogradskyella sp.]|uniref:dihydrofolate reductase family protein n=1 Tax=uncultured Winogradskyella sp. TaxID=395353 RepID=UPI00263963FF|nr:dihydrofolate reductase family protein [uncultured Winogradskyella sp.]
MEPKNKVFIATSLDGYIADKNGGIAWLDDIPEINTIDTGYETFTSQIDAMLMGRTTFETVLSFGIEWPYKKPVFVLSRTLTKVPQNLKGKVFLVNGTLKEVLQTIHNKGLYRLYIDGGKTIQSFLKQDLIDEIIITIIPTLLGGGLSLFGELSEKLQFECVSSKVYLDKIVQNRFVRKKV